MRKVKFVSDVGYKTASEIKVSGGSQTCAVKGDIMNIWDIILSVILIAAVVLAIIRCVRVKKRGGCGCGCSDCSASCAGKNEEGRKKGKTPRGRG